MSELPTGDGRADTDVSAGTRPAAANISGPSTEIDSRIADISRELSTGLLETIGLSVSEKSGSAFIAYTKETPVEGGKVTEVTEFQVPDYSDKEKIGVKYRTTYRHSKDGESNPVDEELQMLHGLVGASAARGDLLGLVGEVSAIGNSAKAPEGFRPLEKNGKVLLGDVLSGMKDDPGLITVTFRPTSMLIVHPELIAHPDA